MLFRVSVLRTEYILATALHAQETNLLFTRPTLSLILLYRIKIKKGYLNCFFRWLLNWLLLFLYILSFIFHFRISCFSFCLCCLYLRASSWLFRCTNCNTTALLEALAAQVVIGDRSVEHHAFATELSRLLFFHYNRSGHCNYRLFLYHCF